LDDEGIVADFDLDILFFQAGQLGTHYQLTVALDHLDRRRPDGLTPLACTA
jgi:hypothetical protein